MIPNALGHLRILERQIRDLGCHAGEVFLDVVQCEEGIRLLVIRVDEHEFAVPPHDGIHPAWVVDDHRAVGSCILVLIHADIGVVGEDAAVVAGVRRRA